MSMQLSELTIEKAHQGLINKEFSSRELTEACLAEIKKRDDELHAFLTVTDELALQQAVEADKRIHSGEAGPLTGIPIAVKDNIVIDGVRTTGGSKILDNYTAIYDATVITRLKKAGAVFVGKTNMDEFAMGSSTENSAYAKTANPHDRTRTPGGSSGGSAAAVAADLCLGALGSDTGGSIRQPAAFCGVVGLKPTYGRVSRFGLLAMTSSLDQIGPLTKTIKDNALMFRVIAGRDENDSTTVEAPAVDIKKIEQGIEGLTIGLPHEYFVEGMDERVRDLVEKAAEQLKKLGAKIIKVNLPLTKYALAVYQLTVTSEISANLARYDGIRYGFSEKDGAKTLLETYMKSKAKGFGDEVKRRIILGTFALSAGYYDRYYLKAQKVRALITQEFQKIFKKVDCLLTPTAPSVAFKLGEKFSDPLMMYLSDIYTCPANIGGICGLSLPCGFVGGLPAGLQLLAKPLDEQTLFRVGWHYEQVTQWHLKKPPFT